MISEEAIAECIAAQGYAICHDFMPGSQIRKLAVHGRQLFADGNMRRGGIGSQARQHSLRGDYLHWLQASDATAYEQDYLQRMDSLRIALNRQLYLGLFDLESHYALYPAGASYARHLDRLQADPLQGRDDAARPQRQLSSILYLNQDWRSEQGGQLRLYLQTDGSLLDVDIQPHLGTKPYLDIQPTAGTLVLFLSDTFAHEVLAASRERLSVPGWFRTRGAELA